MEKLKKIIVAALKVVRIVVVILVLSLVGFIVAQRFTDNKFSLMGYRMFTIITGSMDPEYKVGDVIFSKTIDTKKLVVGDDVVYRGKIGSFADKIVTHRIIRIVENEGVTEFYTKGIANSGEDPVVYSDQIMGIVTGKNVFLTGVTKFVTHPLGFMLLIFLPISYLAASSIMEKFKVEDDEDEEELEIIE